MVCEVAVSCSCGGRRYSAFVADGRDTAIFSVGRLPDAGSTRRVAEDPRAPAGGVAWRHAGDSRRRRRGRSASRRSGCDTPRSAAGSGFEWDGAKQPTIWIAPPPEI